MAFLCRQSLTNYSINETKGKINEFKLGHEFETRERFEILIRRGSWFGAKVNDISSYSLVGCTVIPAFRFEDFQLADREALLASCPGYKDIIEMLTKSQ